MSNTKTNHIKTKLLGFLLLFSPFLGIGQDTKNTKELIRDVSFNSFTYSNLHKIDQEKATIIKDKLTTKNRRHTM